MRGSSGGWIELARSVGQASLELLRSELAALGADFTGSGQRLLRALALLLLTLFFLFWAVGALAYFCVELLALWLPRWGASLALLGILGLVTAILAAVTWWKLRRIEKPAATLQRRLAEHTDWWQSRIAAAREEAAPASLTEGTEE